MFFGKKAKSRENAPIAEQLPEELIIPEDEAIAEEVIEEPAAETPAEEEQEVPEQEILHEDTGEDLMRDSDLTAAISRNTVVKGDITTEDNLEIFGTVEGNVTSAAVIKIYGAVTGNIACGVLVAHNASITGDIKSEKSVVLGMNTAVKGNIQTGSINISGRVNGNIVAAESTAINSDGRVFGDITTSSIEVSKGAVVDGAVAMDEPSAKAGQEEAPAAEPIQVTYSQEEEAVAAQADA